LEIGVKLAHVLWRKEQPDDRADADSNLIEVTFDLLVEGRWALAQRLLDFGTQTLKKWSSDERRRTLVVNRCQAYKWGGRSEMARRILEVEDWSAAADKFKLAEAVLHDDFAKAALLMAKLGADSKDVQKGDYREWPLFREFRRSAEFLSTYEQLYAEPFRVTTPKGMVQPLGVQVATD
jgi:hypothetical protein